MGARVPNSAGLRAGHRSFSSPGLSPAMLLLLLASAALASSSPLLLSRDLPTGTCVFRLPSDTTAAIADASLAAFFRLTPACLVTAGSLATIPPDSVLRLRLSSGGTSRLERLRIRIRPDEVLHFTSGAEAATLGLEAAAGTRLSALEPIEAFVAENPSKTVSFRLSNGTASFLGLQSQVDTISRRHSVHITTTRALLPSDVGVHDVILSATVDSEPWNTRNISISVRIDADRRPFPPIFGARGYTTHLKQSETRAGSLLRVRAHSRIPGAAITYALIDPRLGLDVDPLSGDLFSTRLLGVGDVRLRVQATDSHGNSGAVPVRLLVTADEGLHATGEEDPKPSPKTRGRFRRDVRTDLNFQLREDFPSDQFLPRSIYLGAFERVKGAPVVKEHLTVFANGSIKLTQPLNYEKWPTVEALVIIENSETLEDSAERVVVGVEDVDERPAFLNAPTPYQGVVPTDVPIGYTVYKFSARDEDGDGDADVEYRLLSTEPPGLFTVDASNGRVKTASNRYEEGKKYLVYVQARDKTPTDSAVRDSDVAILDIRGGSRPPQFFQTSYDVAIPEDTPVHASVVDVEARSFQNRPNEVIRFSLWEDSNGFSGGRVESETFAVDERSGVIRLQAPLNYDDPLKPRIYHLKVVGREGAMENVVDVNIGILDVNDNDPVFTQPLYSTTIPENHPIGEPIISVSGRDADDGPNGLLSYSVDDGNFSVSVGGAVSARRRLDADQDRLGFHIYKLRVTARDGGKPQRSATSTVHIRTENVNDEAPFFHPTNQYTAYVAENAEGNTPVVTIQAQDPDRDQVSYAFRTPSQGETFETSFFSIDKDTGLIQLRPSVRASDLTESDVYNLTVVAKDDGSCCPDGHLRSHQSLATLIIGIADVNNNKPVFHNCEGYTGRATVPEGKHDNFSIIQVEALDEDSQQNGLIEYSLYYPKGEARRAFHIDPVSGLLMASPYVDFDREERPFEDVTVKATDKGERPLIGFCQFTVRVADANDNAPQFDRASYETSVSRSTSVGQSVVTVFADDRDGPDNARITYRLLPDTITPPHADDVKYFSIKKESGEISLISHLPGSKTKLKFLVEANDNGVGSPQTQRVDVLVNVRSSLTSAPTWAEDPVECPLLKRVPENMQINSVFFRCYASSPSDPTAPISYSMANGAKPGTNSKEHFRAFTSKRNGDFEVIVRNMHQLDFEATKAYNLTITATDLRSGVSTDKYVNVELADRNDEVPKFTLDKFIGQVREEEEPRLGAEPVASVLALDADAAGTAAAAVTYRILANHHAPNFRIDAHSGQIFALRKFDREVTDSFILAVEAQDGSKSDLPGASGPNSDITKVQIFVEDINDNSPFFNRSREFGKVRENAEIGQNVMTVKAHDKDRETNLKYSLVPLGSGERSPFGVNANSGTVFVKESLDFELRQNYSLILRVTDGKHDATTNIFIDILDVNDNAPVFAQKLYARSMEEEFVPSEPLLRVSATDRDAAASGGGIVYRLEGQGAEEFFSIDATSGHIRVLKPLDRDPPFGAAKWTFVVQAIDDGGQGLIGYADVQVTLTDINDNEPHFEGGPFQGFIEENSKPKDPKRGVYVMRMTAIDYDDPTTPNAKLAYRIQRNKEFGDVPVFNIEPDTGKIFAMMPLDRENSSQRQFDIEVHVHDKGRPSKSGTGTLRIIVLDVNDNAPSFPRSRYEGSVLETAAVETAVLTVSATDLDDEASDNVLHYELIPDDSLGFRHFYITTDPDSSGSNVGVLRVKKPLDFEDAAQRGGFSVGIRVTDGRFSAATTAAIRLADANDNAPVLSGPKDVDVAEDVAVGTRLATFTAADPDFGGRDAHTFRINRTSDSQRQFTINRHGALSIAKPLDREAIANYRLRIEAEDSAGNVGSNILQVYLSDVNDNAPELYTTRPAVVWEDAAAPQLVAEVFGKDPDTPANGPPFTMRQVREGPSWDMFTMAFNRTGDDGRGVMRVSTKVAFDREGPAGKIIQLPISISDNGVPKQTRVRYLDVIIGDKNDNPMYDGRKAITVFNYMGQMPTSYIGTVFVEDADDWDRGDKTFQWVSDKPPYFSLRAGGAIWMDSGVRQGNYTMEVKVMDATKSPVETAIGTVVVNVVEIPEAAFDNSGSFRLRGITAEQFITANGGTQSPYQIFQKHLAQKLNVPVHNVQIFSVMDKGGAPAILDVRFAAHNSPYHPAIGLDGVMAANRDDFENLVAGISLIQTRISECVWETCDLGCHTVATASTRPQVINSNQTALIGVMTNTTRVCSCPEVAVADDCASNPCLNNGICHATYPGFFCECRGPYKGPMCEGRVRSFDGTGWAWFEPVSACMESHISLEFITRQANALLLFNGPMYAKTQFDQMSEDYFVVEIVGGKIQVRLSLGSAETRIVLDRGTDVHNGEWHTVDIYRVKQEVEVVLDKCQTAVVQQTPGGVFLDTSNCSKTLRAAGDFEQLNMNTPIQLGGVAPTGDPTFTYSGLGPTPVHFDGCVRNLVVNDKLYDLANPGRSEGSAAGCTQTQANCDSNSLDGPGYCVHGECVASYTQRKCDCDPGWTGPRCEKRTGWVQFASASAFINYAFAASTRLPAKETDIKLLFLADSDNGELARGQNVRGSKYLAPQLENRHLVFDSQLGGHARELRLGTGTALARNQSYWLHIQRVNEWSRMSLDNLPGRFTAESRSETVDQQLDLTYDKQAFFLGANGPNTGFRGCVGDFRWDNYWLPLNTTFSSEDVNYASVTKQVGVTDGCPLRTTCADVPSMCSAPFVCFDFWKGPFCTCPDGMSIVQRDGVLVSCGESSAYLKLGLSYSAVVAILVSLLALIVLVLFLVVYSKRRRPGPTPFLAGDDIRENIINYREEGGGEEDQDTYNIAPLRKPVLPTNGLGAPPYGATAVPPRPSPGEVGEFIRARKAEADSDPSAPPFDELRLYADEGAGLSPSGSLSSLDSLPDALDAGDVARWGPRFAGIADLYQ